MMIIDNLFEIGQKVYLKTDTEQKERIVTGMLVRQCGYINYEVSCGTEVKWHCEIEMTAEKDVLKSTTS